MTTLINAPIHGGPCLEFTLQRVRCVEPLRDLEPFLRVSRVHPLLITPRDVRFRRDFSIECELSGTSRLEGADFFQLVVTSPTIRDGIGELLSNHETGVALLLRDGGAFVGSSRGWLLHDPAIEWRRANKVLR